MKWMKSWVSSRAGLRWGVGIAVAVLLAVGVGAVATRTADAPRSDGAVNAASMLPEPVEPAAEDAALSSVGSSAATDPEPDAAAGEADDGTAEEAPGETAPAAGPIDWVSPTAPSPISPVPAEDRVPKPEAVRGIYVGAWSVGSNRRFEQLVRLADETEVNAFVIDVKDVTGEISYASQVPLARQLGATRQIKIADIRGRLERLREHGIYPIARIVVFKDPLLATARPEWSIVRKDGSIWADNNGVHWVDSFNRNVWEYNIELAREAIALGFSEIQWDYVRFPDVPRSYMVEAVYPARDGRTMADGIREFMIHGRDRLADLDVPVTADVFGIATSAYTDVGIGQLWEKMADVVDVLLPMVYPSHYPRGSWSYPNPNAAPYQIVKKAMDHGVARSRKIENSATIRPWLQAFSLGKPDYGPEHIRAQIDAVYDAGLTEWILWSASVRYPREAFATADGEEPWFAGQGESLYQPEPVRDSVKDGEEPAGEPVGR